MSEGDFRSTERSVTVADEGEVRIELAGEDGRVTVLKASVPVLAGEVLDAAVMSREALDRFLAEQIADAKEQGVLFSVHLKATMMKVSDPIIFGRAVRAFFPDVFARHGEALRRAGVNANDGMAALLSALDRLPEDERDALEADIEAAYADGPGPGHGRLRPRHHQPARAQRRDHRCLDAGGHPFFGSDVERRRRAAGHQVRDPRSLLRPAVCRGHRPLPRARSVRSGDDGHRRPTSA